MESIKNILQYRIKNMPVKFKKKFIAEFNVAPQEVHATDSVKKQIENISSYLQSKQFQTLPLNRKHRMLKDWVRKIHLYQEAIDLGFIPHQVLGIKGGKQEK